MFTFNLFFRVQDHVPFLLGKHLKHFMELVLEPWEEFALSWGFLDAFVLGGWSLEEGFSSFLSFPFQVLE